MSEVAPRPLCVDLDGTLIRTDLLVESAVALVKRNVLYLFALPAWLLKGKANLKHQIAARVDVDASTLPYHERFLEFLRQEHAAGRRLVLATASNEKFADSVARHLEIFSDVLASDRTVNLSGHRKLERLESLFGMRGFDYAGNSMVDHVLFEHADRAVLVNPQRRVKEVAEQRGLTVQIFDDRTGRPMENYIKALRLHQWLKNLLIFVPLLMAHRFDEPRLVGLALLAFLSFSLCASSVYLLNDLLDLPDDRRHPSKRYRPFASGTVSIVHGSLLAPGLLVVSFAVALLLPVEFVAVLALYLAVTLAYSLRLKRAALVDVLTLAALYTLRIIAGAAAVTVSPSFWLLAFSMFLFLSLALVKRFTELATLQQLGRFGFSGRGYMTTDLEMLSQFGSSSAHVAVLVLALYINSDAVQGLYRRPELIWLLCPLLLYMITRVWLLARRDKLHEDPVVFVIQDRRSQILVGIGAILLWLAA